VSGPMYETADRLPLVLVTFTDCRIELMWEPKYGRNGHEAAAWGTRTSHVTGSRAGVTSALRSWRTRYSCGGVPRSTGDGITRAVIEDPRAIALSSSNERAAEHPLHVAIPGLGCGQGRWLEN